MRHYRPAVNVVAPADRDRRPRHPAHRPPRDHVPAAVGRGGGGAALITLTTDFGLADPFVGDHEGRDRDARAGRRRGRRHARDPAAGRARRRARSPPRRAVLPARDRARRRRRSRASGATRRALCVETATALLVGPDNGLLSLAAPPAAGRRIVELHRGALLPHRRAARRSTAATCSRRWRPRSPPGRDVDALGPRSTTWCGSRCPSRVREGRQLRGQVIYVDHFGNLVTNLPGDAFPHADVSISIGDARIRGVAVELRRRGARTRWWPS